MKNKFIIMSLATLLLYTYVSFEDVEELLVPYSINYSFSEIEVPENNKETLGDLIDQYLKENNFTKDNISIYVNNFDTEESYSFNQDKYFIAGSIYKLPLAMIYYESILSDEISSSAVVPFLAYHLESGGFVESNYALGSYIPVSDLLYYSIVYSDNSAGMMLFDYLGGWNNYKILATKYSDISYTDEYYSLDNKVNAQYMSDVLSYLYNSTDFSILMEHLNMAMPSGYLNYYSTGISAQKYGMYYNAMNAVGLSTTGENYSIVVLTNLGHNGEVVIGDINEICYEYFNN